MAGYVRLARPLNCGMSAVGVGIAAVVAVGWTGVQGAPWTILLAMGAATLFTAGGNALNDYFDRDTDRVNHPDRPIPRGDMTPGEAQRFAALLFALSLALASLVNLVAVGIVVLNFGVMVAYEKAFKARGASGNALIAYLVGSLFVFGGAAAYAGDLEALNRTLVLGLLAALTTAGREVTKDIEDLAGDVDRATLPRRIGVRGAGALAAGAFVAGVVLSIVPYYLGILGAVYLGIVLAADTIFILCGAYSARNPGRAQRAAKYGMAVALVAFLAGGVLA